MVNKFSTSRAGVYDHKLIVNSISKKSCDRKVLKPKVYILKDSSTFKNLVQELTGNGNVGCANISDTCTSLSSSCATTFKPIDHEQVPIKQNYMIYAREDYGFQETSSEISLHSSDHHVPSDPPPCVIIPRSLDHAQVPVAGDNVMYSTGDYGFQEISPEISFDSLDYHIDLISVPVTSDFSEDMIDHMPTTLVSKDDEFQSTWDIMSLPLEYEGMESWLLEMDSSDYGSNWLQPAVMPQEACAFDNCLY